MKIESSVHILSLSDFLITWLHTDNCRLAISARSVKSIWPINAITMTNQGQRFFNYDALLLSMDWQRIEIGQKALTVGLHGALVTSRIKLMRETWKKGRGVDGSKHRLEAGAVAGVGPVLRSCLPLFNTLSAGLRNRCTCQGGDKAWTSSVYISYRAMMPIREI
ncbi:hypothetical protein RRG08_006911 [Elysia crispata]|uniref:Uncharacterized protein n=1 Tax=Elysia crispata TaxID=231223 RepID=A0AAE1BC00_9GAST|nr:hypothetical protein RRG08_006911 [Elysia crispata]